MVVARTIRRVGYLKRILIIPIFVVLITVLLFLSHDASASQVILFHDDYSSSAGWTQVGTGITVNSPQFPNQVKFNETGGGGKENQVYKALSSTLPSGRWTAEFNYEFTASQNPAAEIFALSADTHDPSTQPLDNEVRIIHGYGAGNKLGLDAKSTGTSLITISPNTQYYVRLDRTPTLLALSVFSDPARTMQVTGSPKSLPLNPADFNNDLNYIHHGGCNACSASSTLTAQLTNTTIYVKLIAPGAPTGLTATDVSPSQINLAWTGPIDDGGSPITGYKIQRSTDGGATWTTIVTNTGSTATTYSNTGLSPNTTYTYRVFAINSIGISGPSNIASATTTNIPSAPTGLTAIIKSSSEINLYWTVPTYDGGSPITGYKIERDDGGGFNTIVANTGSTATAYSDKGLDTSTTHTYRVSAINANGSSLPSNSATAQHANIVLSDKTSCEASLVSGTWISANSTCRIMDLTLNAGDSLTVYNTLTVNGTITNNESATITNNGNIYNRGVINNYGNLQDGDIFNYGIINNHGTLWNTSTYVNYGVGTINNSNYIYLAGSLSNAGSFINNNGGFIDMQAGTLSNSGKISNNGTISNDSPGFELCGHINNISGATINNTARINNWCTMTNDGTIANFGTINNPGTTNNNGIIKDYCGSTFANTGTLNGNPVINACTPESTTLSSDKDSFVQKLAVNTNEGSSPILPLAAGNNRVLVSFNEADIASAASGKTLQSAKLRLYITNNGNNWGTLGRTIETHKLIDNWTEGNGWNVGNTIRGTGAGVTWNCAIDANVTNFKPDCTAKWIGGNFNSSATSSVLIKNGMTGWIEFDVTPDVQAFLLGAQNHGWLIKKTDETTQGLVKFDSREAASNQPQLVLTFGS